MEPRPLISAAGIPIVSDYGRPREFTAQDLRDMLRRQAYVRVPYNATSAKDAPRKLVVYAKTPNGWREMSRDRVNQAMLMRGPRQNQSLFSSVFVDGLGMPKTAQYENLKKQLLTAAERQQRVKDALSNSDEAELMRAFLAQERAIFEGDNEARTKDLTGMYKQPNQGAYAIVVRLPRGMSVPDLFKPITEPHTRPFEPSAEAVKAMVEQAMVKEEPPETFNFEPEKDLYDDVPQPPSAPDEPEEEEPPQNNAPDEPEDAPPFQPSTNAPVAPPLPFAAPKFGRQRATVDEPEVPPFQPSTTAPVAPPLPFAAPKFGRQRATVDSPDIKSEDLMLADDVPPPPPLRPAPRVTFEEKPDFLTVLRKSLKNPEQLKTYNPDDESGSAFLDEEY